MSSDDNRVHACGFCRRRREGRTPSASATCAWRRSTAGRRSLRCPASTASVCCASSAGCTTTSPAPSAAGSSPSRRRSSSSPDHQSPHADLPDCNNRTVGRMVTGSSDGSSVDMPRMCNSRVQWRPEGVLSQEAAPIKGTVGHSHWERRHLRCMVSRRGIALTRLPDSRGCAYMDTLYQQVLL